MRGMLFGEIAFEHRPVERGGESLVSSQRFVECDGVARFLRSGLKLKTIATDAAGGMFGRGVEILRGVFVDGADEGSPVAVEADGDGWNLRGTRRDGGRIERRRGSVRVLS